MYANLLIDSRIQIIYTLSQRSLVPAQGWHQGRQIGDLGPARARPCLQSVTKLKAYLSVSTAFLSISVKAIESFSHS